MYSKIARRASRNKSPPLDVFECNTPSGSAHAHTAEYGWVRDRAGCDVTQLTCLHKYTKQRLNRRVKRRARRRQPRAYSLISLLLTALLLLDPRHFGRRDERFWGASPGPVSRATRYCGQVALIEP
ncbi:hypothetical protein EVAR_68400_1 [Eumeta japonica]|uniref:Uncharacterized protein n=1 Tax=Eumeta variegata TaxID=151549 RepID=A0A4C2ACB2_EUMVA|nr:hypothetical protein EVAR_68400_1 [Eumeta japonica]